MIAIEMQKPTRRRRLFCGPLVPNVGAGLLAKALCQPTSRVSDTPSSRASPLPQKPYSRVSPS
ncbi:hypothetical protein FHG55_17250 [Pseudomonas jessenii]|uniref:Uncharacterized protein n=1 Tax=Pseudomonas jessenii TaxID=77298 RepID=A0A5C4KTK0_PSEJE|nr:hypothetical protein C1895_10470 [Pseudomonas sp. FW305-3-2-15-E-TSA4]POA39734.1 hypothetical protein C1894_18925 [Pseudomonas sp. FW305-3-2-15-E-TSA2]TNB93472.1 hypothetical protein FHG55_17250 [Pseudomonas jessenii]